MCRTGTIFIILIAIAAVIGVHRHRGRRMRPPAPIVDDRSLDVAQTLRQLQGQSENSSHKGWATRFVDFVNEHPGRQWVVGRCSVPCLSEAEAAQQAREDAARKVLPIIGRQLRASPWDSQWLQDRVMQDVRDGRLEADRFAEQFNRPYGQVWTESVLLDVSPENLDSLDNNYRAELSTHHVQTGRRLAAGAVVILLTGLLYILLNIATKGYFTLRLRLATAVIVAAVIILLV